MKEYVTPSVTGHNENSFLAPAMAVIGLSKAAAFAVGAAAGLVAAALSGDESVTSGAAGLEPCLE